MKPIIKFGLVLKKTGELVGFTTSPNEGDDCCGICYELDDTSDRKWLVDSAEHAEYVRKFTTPWYNAGYDTPINEYDKDELEVVKVTQVIEPTKDFRSVPSMEEYLKVMYEKDDPNHYSYIMEEYKKHKDTFANYSFYDLERYFEKVKKDENC